MTERLGLFLGGACLFLLAAEAHADDKWKSNQSVWVAEDRCARTAFKQFPDYTPEGNAKRQRAMQQCLAGGNLPARGPTAPAVLPPPATPAPAEQPH